MNIYADHAATTKLDPAAFEAMKPYLTEEYGNASQLYSFARLPKKAIKEARETIADCIGAQPDEIYFTSGGTESDNWAIKGTTLFHENCSVITSEIEHHAVLKACNMLERLHHPITYLRVDNKGIIHPDSLDATMIGSARLVTIMLANNEIGSIEPVKELVEVAHSHGALFHTDAVQAVGHVPVQVKDLGIDLLSASAHKFNGPKGIGFLYVKKGIDINSYLDGGAQERGKRAGTENIPAIVGMAKALEINVKRMETNKTHLHNLGMRLMKHLKDAGIDFIQNGDASNHIPGNMSLSFKNIEGETLLHRLDLMGIFVSTGSACNSISTELSHVIKAIRVPAEYAYGTIRISLGYENTEDEIDKIARAIPKILDK